MTTPVPASQWHALLSSQIEDVTSDNGLDIARLLEKISLTYSESDRQRRRRDRASTLMAEEIELQTDALQEAIRSLGIQNLRFQAALDNMPQGLSLFDADGRLVVCNRMFRTIYDLDTAFDPTGLGLTDILGQSCLSRLDAVLDDSARLQARLAVMTHVAFAGDSNQPLEQIWPNGRTIRIMRNGLDDGGFLDLTCDITESRMASARIAHMAHYDALTDLPNRTLFRETLEAAVESDRRRKERFAVFCLDLDRFKAVNDTLGHPIGDALLIEVAQRLRSVLRSGDVAARLGGDEFGILVSRVKRAGDVHRLADRIINRLSQPYEIQGHQMIVGVSIGIEFSEANGATADEYLRNADLALNRAKTEGRGCAQVFQPELHMMLDRRRQLELDLRRAMTNDEFVVWYQPQFCVKKGIISGFEALVRWQSPTRGLVSPADFIGLSEEIGLIDQLGAWVLKRACRDAAAMPAHLTMAVNLSPIQFRSRRLVQSVQTILHETGLDPTRLELEVTESVMIADAQDALQTLRALKALGVRISLDDFGTGYSSLSYIRNFPFDKIKIDQSFVRDLGKTDDSLAIIRAVSGICSSLGICSVAEGVETQGQFDILKSEKCDNLQGYLFGRPVPLANTAAFYQSPLRDCG
jgi:diguanylate cyclase (GGDEF)-like protein